jgi:hypothetical protein
MAQFQSVFSTTFGTVAAGYASNAHSCVAALGGYVAVVVWAENWVATDTDVAQVAAERDHRCYGGPRRQDPGRLGCDASYIHSPATFVCFSNHC